MRKLLVVVLLLALMAGFGLACTDDEPSLDASFYWNLSQRVADLEDRVSALEGGVTTTTTEAPTTTTTRPPTTTTILPVTTTTTQLPASFDLQREIDRASPGVTVTVPQGTYHLSRPISMRNVTVDGNGSVFVFAGGQSGFHFYNLNHAGLKNMTIKSGTEYGVGYGVMLEGNCSNLSFSNLTVRDFKYFGLFSPDGVALSDSTFTDVSVFHCGDFGFHVNGSGRNLTFDGCVAEDFAGLHYQPHGFYIKNTTNLVFRDCVARGPLGDRPHGQSGFDVHNSQVTFINCRAIDNKVDSEEGYGFLISGSGTAMFQGCSGSGNLYDFYECSYRGSATYVNCVGTKLVWNS